MSWSNHQVEAQWEDVLDLAPRKFYKRRTRFKTTYYTHAHVSIWRMCTPRWTNTPSLTLEDSLDFGHHRLNAFFTIRLVVTFPAWFVLCGAHLFGYRHAFFKQSVNIIVKLLLEESTARRGSWVYDQMKTFYLLEMYKLHMILRYGVKKVVDTKKQVVTKIKSIKLLLVIVL